MITEFDKEILEAFDKEILAGEITIHQNISNYNKLIQNNFPFISNGIAWSVIDHAVSKKIDISNVENKYAETTIFLNNIIKKIPELKNENVVVFGDYETELGYEMTFSKFIENYKLFIDLPQDTYVWFINSKKCFNYTFEDELFFG